MNKLFEIINNIPRIEPEKQPLSLIYTTIIIFSFTLIGVFYLNSFYKKPKPFDRPKITSNSIVGTVESIHPWGRTEIVPMKRVELEYFEYCDEWVMYGDVIQPVGRKDYFMPVMKGRLDLDVKDMTQTWIEYGSYETGSLEKPETYTDFRLAHIKVKSGKIIDIEYTHYRLLSNNTWNIIASWKAIVNPDITESNP